MINENVEVIQADVEAALEIFNSGLVRQTDARNSRGYTTFYHPEDSMRAVLENFARHRVRHQPQERGAVLDETELREVVLPVIGACLLMRSDDPRLADERLGVAAEVARAVKKHLTTPAPAVSTDEIVAVLEDAGDHLHPLPPERGRVMNKPEHFIWSMGTRLRKKKGSSWQGKVVGFYCTTLTPEGYAIESEREPGSVQIYPLSALEEVDSSS